MVYDYHDNAYAVFQINAGNTRCKLDVSRYLPSAHNKRKSLKENWKNFPLKYIYGVILAFHFLQPLFVSWRGMGSTYFYVIQYVMTTYLHVFLGFCIAPDYKKLMEHKKWMYSLLLILFVIAVICRVTTYNFISNTLSEESIWTSDRAQSERGFRVTATLSSPNILDLYACSSPFLF